MDPIQRDGAVVERIWVFVVIAVNLEDTKSTLVEKYGRSCAAFRRPSFPDGRRTTYELHCSPNRKTSTACQLLLVSRNKRTVSPT